MIKAIVLKWKTVACLVFVLAWLDVNAQCDLVITNPPCQAAGPVNLTAASVTAGTANIGTLTYWTNSSATTALANPNAVNVSGFYWIKNTVGSCTDVKPVAVTIGTVAPTGSTNLFPSCSHSATTPNAIFFDWYNNIGETGFTYSYSINGGPPVTASILSPSSHIVSGLVPGDRVEFWVSWTGVCTPPLHTIAYPESNPVFNLTNGQHLCQGAALPATDVNGMVGTWNHPIVSSVNGSPGNYQFTPNGCASPIVFQLFADPIVTPTFTPIAPICVGSAAPVLPASSNNTPAIPGTWNPATINTAAAGTQVFTFTPNPGQCANTTTLSVTVSNGATPTFAAYPATLCHNSPAPPLPASTNGIAGVWSPTTISTTTLGPKSSTFVPNPGQCVSATPVTINVNVVQNVVPTFNPIAPFCAGTAAPALPASSIEGFAGTWSPATISNTASGTYTFTPNAALCATTATLNVTVTPAPTTTFNFPSNTLTFCSGSPMPSLPTSSSNTPAVTGTWSPAAISNTVSGTYTFTPNAGQCATTYVLNVVITPPASIHFNSLPLNFSICVGSPPPPLPAQSDNNPPITGTWNAAAINTATPGVRTYTFQATAGQCVGASFYTITVDVTPKTIPIYGPILPFCEGTVPPEGLALPTTINGIIGTWSPASAIDNTITGHTVYTFTPAANQCAEVTILNINVTPRDITDFTLQQIPSFCAGTTPIPTLPTISDNGITGTWSPAVIDNMLTGTYTFTPDAGFCATTATLTVTVIQPISSGFTDLTLCENNIPALESISPLGISGTWNPAVIDPTLPAATYTFTPDAGECALPQTINVTVNFLTLQNVTWTATSYFSDNAVITVTAIDPGNYLYQLDFGPLYASNVFTNVSPGTHMITVYDANGCSPAIIHENAVTIVDYPRFFTPNGDGFNDYWNIFELAAVGQGQAVIYLFDRHGKLLKQLAPAGLGWDGTYNGKPLPSSDYWFVVNYTELGVPREFKAHFSLKR